MFMNEKDYGIKYIEGEDGILYPDLTLEQRTHHAIGKYGLIIGEYIMKSNRHEYITKLMDGTWNEYLYEVEVECWRQVEELMAAMKRAEGITEELKNIDPLEWVRRMNAVQMRAEREVVESWGGGK
jgi:hypothetical protein